MKKTTTILLAGIGSFYTLQAQNVGIGTTIPAEKLHVAGNLKVDTVKSSSIRMTTGAGDGKILTSDGTGNGRWLTNNAVATSNIGYGV
ncbi:MAG TPA: hypothetical protein VGO58_05115 [Chitinophagaceae bacterium]|jgi:hypothetical protein|nr:hypothetical protein [Chitinophagaceae bacterium]